MLILPPNNLGSSLLHAATGLPVRRQGGMPCPGSKEEVEPVAGHRPRLRARCTGRDHSPRGRRRPRRLQQICSGHNRPLRPMATVEGMLIVHIVILLVQCNEGHGLVKYGRPLSRAYVSYDWSRGPVCADCHCICLTVIVLLYVLLH